MARRSRRTRLHVLLIEDEVSIRRGLRELLELEGAWVAEASTAREGLEALRRRPDLVVLDLALPDGSGYGILEQLDQRRRRPRVVVFTGHGGFDEGLESVRRGADRFLTKDLDPEHVLAEILRAALAA